MFKAAADLKMDKKKLAQICDYYRQQMLMVAENILQDRSDAEDAVQNALEAITRNAANLPLRSERVLRAYMLTAAKNAALNIQKANQRKVKLEKHYRRTYFEKEKESFCDELLQAVTAKLSYERLVEIIRSLDPKYREVLLLMVVEEHSIKEAADILGRKPDTVKQQLRRAKEKVKELCRKEGIGVGEE